MFASRFVTQDDPLLMQVGVDVVSDLSEIAAAKLEYARVDALTRLTNDEIVAYEIAILVDGLRTNNEPMPTAQQLELLRERIIHSRAGAQHQVDKWGPANGRVILVRMRIGWKASDGQFFADPTAAI